MECPCQGTPEKLLHETDLVKRLLRRREREGQRGRLTDRQTDRGNRRKKHETRQNATGEDRSSGVSGSPFMHSTHLAHLVVAGDDVGGC